jgi:hypothetical protein
VKELAAVGRRRLEHHGDLVVLVIEDLAQQEDGPLLG